MSQHRYDENIKDVKSYFDAVLSWVNSVFPTVYTEMKGLDWGTLYERYHHLPYDPSKVDERVASLMDDPQITDRKGIFEYVLGGEQNTRLLNVRVFDRRTIQLVYNQQTAKAKEMGVSNCPYCAIGHDSSRNRILKINEMDADHVTAWSKGGSTDISNCQMLCRMHNRAKGNR